MNKITYTSESMDEIQQFLLTNKEEDLLKNTYDFFANDKKVIPNFDSLYFNMLDYYVDMFVINDEPKTDSVLENTKKKIFSVFSSFFKKYKDVVVFNSKIDSIGDFTEFLYSISKFELAKYIFYLYSRNKDFIVEISSALFVFPEHEFSLTEYNGFAILCFGGF